MPHTPFASCLQKKKKKKKKKERKKERKKEKNVGPVLFALLFFFLFVELPNIYHVYKLCYSVLVMSPHIHVNLSILPSHFIRLIVTFIKINLDLNYWYINT